MSFLIGATVFAGGVLLGIAISRQTYLEAMKLIRDRDDD